MKSQSNFSLNWSGNTKATPRIIYPKNLEELKKIMSEKNFIIAGNQRSFGDNSINTNLIVSMKNFKQIILASFLATTLIGCQVTIPPSQGQTNYNSTNATTLTILDAKALKGSEKVSVHAYSYTRGSDMCSRTIALQFASALSYTRHP